MRTSNVNKKNAVTTDFRYIHTAIRKFLHHSKTNILYPLKKKKKRITFQIKQR